MAESRGIPRRLKGVTEHGLLRPTSRSEVGFDRGFNDRLKQVVADTGNPNAFAAKSGISPSGLKRLLAGGDPTLPVLLKIVKAGSVELQWLATGEGPMRLSEHPSRGRTPSVAVVPREALGDGFVLVPRYDAEASAGAGRFFQDIDIIDHLAFKASWVRSALGADPASLALLSAAGDSMEPTIRAGDLLLIDRSISRFIDEAIYVLVLAGALMVKRVQRLMNGVVLMSDNPAYKPLTLSQAEIDELQIAGRLRWIARLA